MVKYKTFFKSFIADTPRGCYVNSIGNFTKEVSSKDE